MIPEGWRETRDFDRALSIKTAMNRTGGHCPCVPHDTWSDDTLCPCLYFRDGNGCHCGLYVQEEED